MQRRRHTWSLAAAFLRSCTSYLMTPGWSYPLLAHGETSLLLLLRFAILAEVEMVEFPVPAMYGFDNLSEGEHRHLGGLGNVMLYFTALGLVSDLPLSNVDYLDFENITIC